MKVLDLFSGIGGFSLGLERAGMETVAFCEIEDYPRKVLAKHWPDVPIYSDIRELTSERLRSDGIIGIDVITAGFPCQDISTAGKGAGIEGERSGLWSEIARLAGELRPRYIILENVSALLSRGLDKVLGDLAEIGYDAEWHCIPASHLGAPHRRDRWWCVCYPDNNGFPAAEITRGAGTGSYHSKTGSKSACEPTRPNQQQPSVADSASEGKWEEANQLRSQEESLSDKRRTRLWDGSNSSSSRPKVSADVADTNESIATQDDANADSQRPHRAYKHVNRSGQPADGKERKPRSVREVLAGSGNTGKRRSADVADTNQPGLQGRQREIMPERAGKWSAGASGNQGDIGGQSKPNMGILAHGLSLGLARSRWLPEPGVGRVTAGIPDRTSRLKALGNSLIPQMPELIGRAIMAIEADR